MIIHPDEVGELRHTAIGDAMIMDSEVVIHKSGKVFIRYTLENLMDLLIKDMVRNIDDDYDNIVIIEGGEGSGKSSITWQLCSRMNPSFDFRKQIAYDIDELEDLLKKGDDKHSIFWLDEAYDIMNKRDWNTNKNKKFVRLLVKMRSRGWTLMMDIPRAEDSDVYIREHRARYMITCEPGKFLGVYHERGIFELKKRNRFGKWEHIGYGLYDAMPTEIKKEYEEVKAAAQDKELQDEKESPGGKYKKKYENQSKRLSKSVFLLKEAGFGRDFITQELGINDSTYYNLIKKGKRIGDLDVDEEESD